MFTKISFTRGDTKTLTAYADNRPFEAGDTVRFTVKKNTASPAVITKTITEFTEQGKAVIPLAHADTKDIDFGSYIFDCELTDSSGNVYTFVKGSFELTWEATDE